MRLAGRRLVACLAALLLGATPPPAAAQGAGGHATRAAQEFADRIVALQRAARARDAAAIERLLAPDFEALRAEDVEDVQPREDWLEAEARRRGDVRAERMSVREFGELAVLTYVLRNGATARFVVDTWRRQGGGWQLELRSSAPLPRQPAGPRKQY